MNCVDDIAERKLDRRPGWVELKNSLLREARNCTKLENTQSENQAAHTKTFLELRDDAPSVYAARFTQEQGFVSRR